MKLLTILSAFAAVAAAQVNDTPPPIFSTPPVVGVNPGPQTNTPGFTNGAFGRRNRAATNGFGAPGASTNSRRGGITNSPIMPPQPGARRQLPTLPGTTPTEPGVPPANPNDGPPAPTAPGTDTAPPPAGIPQAGSR